MADSVAVSRRPSHKATSVTLERSGGAIKSGWKVPAAATKTSNAARWEWLTCFWKLICNDGKFEMLYENRVNPDDFSSTTSSTMAWSRFKGAAQMGSAWSGLPLSRAAFWPLTSTKITSVVFNPMAFNWVGAGDGTRTVRKVYTPRKAAVEISYDENAGEATFAVTPGDSSDFCERYDTRWRVTAKRSDEKTARVLRDWATFTGGSASWLYDVYGLGADFATGTVVTLTAEAYSRGLAGDGPTSKASVTVAYPRTPSIKSVALTSPGSTGRVVVAVKTGTYNSQVRLQRVVGLAPGVSPDSSTTWADVDGAVDDQQCSQLYDMVADARPATDGTYTWYRLVATNCGWTQYSAPVRANALYTPAQSAANDRVGVVSATVNSDRVSAFVLVGYNEDSANTGTELQWTDLGSWYTTDEPNSYVFTWVDGAAAHAGRDAPGWAGTTGVHVRGLEVGKTYRFRARRYLENGDTTSYTPWSNTATLKLAEKPASVTLHAPAFVRRGDDIEVSWEYEGDADQTSWAVHPTASPKKSWASGRGTVSYASIGKARYGAGDSASFYVSVATGGEACDSNAVTVAVADVPTCFLLVTGDCASKPYSFQVYSDNPDVDVLATVASYGVSRDGPAGATDQLAGDVVWTGAVHPQFARVVWYTTALYTRWRDLYDDAVDAGDAYRERLYSSLLDKYANGVGYMATVEVPASADLVDGGAYEVRVRARDSATGLTSLEASAGFAVAWAHQAPAPSDGIVPTVDYEERSVSLALAAPPGVAEGDVYDVYRKAQPGYDLVASDLALDASVTDAYAPFGSGVDLAYRVALRTADGDVEYADYPYELPLAVLRVDFAGGHVELPYDIAMSDSWTKAFEGRAHVDGGVNGYWDAGVSRKGSFTTRAVRVDAGQMSALRALASHAGACMVRTPDGQAFQADVEVAIDQAYDSMAANVTLSVAAVRLTDYMAERT